MLLEGSSLYTAQPGCLSRPLPHLPRPLPHLPHPLHCRRGKGRNLLTLDNAIPEDRTFRTGSVLQEMRGSYNGGRSK